MFLRLTQLHLARFGQDKAENNGEEHHYHANGDAVDKLIIQRVIEGAHYNQANYILYNYAKGNKVRLHF